MPYGVKSSIPLLVAGQKIEPLVPVQCLCVQHDSVFLLSPFLACLVKHVSPLPVFRRSTRATPALLFRHSDAAVVIAVDTPRRTVGNPGTTGNVQHVSRN